MVAFQKLQGLECCEVVRWCLKAIASPWRGFGRNQWGSQYQIQERCRVKYFGLVEISCLNSSNCSKSKLVSFNALNHSTPLGRECSWALTCSDFLLSKCACAIQTEPKYFKLERRYTSQTKLERRSFTISNDIGMNLPILILSYDFMRSLLQFIGIRGILAIIAEHLIFFIDL